MDFAPFLAIVAFAAGTVLWTVQIEQTADWQSCINTYEADKKDSTLVANATLMPIFAARTRITPIRSRSCMWDWATTWTDLLLAPHREIDSWTFMTFWQNFSFVTQNGITHLHTNNWTLTSPSIQPSEADLPLKTLLYDLTPLYRKLGDGPLMQISCMPPEQSGSYWRNHLVALPDDQRALMNVCPRNNDKEQNTR